jgi:hypothetical protein
MSVAFSFLGRFEEGLLCRRTFLSGAGLQLLRPCSGKLSSVDVSRFFARTPPSPLPPSTVGVEGIEIILN